MAPKTRPIVYLSQFNWTPGANGVDFDFPIGSEAIARGKTEAKRVRIKSELMTHDAFDGYVREVEFLDGSGTFAIDASCLEPSDERKQIIASGRRELGL